MIPNGYKQTEVGLIPEDWRCAKIEDIATISMCKRIFADQTTLNGEIPFYKIGTFGKEADAYISRKLYNEYRNRFSFPQKGDVLISAAGTLGRTVVYDGKDAYFQDSNIVWLDIDKNALCNEYLNHYYRVIKWASSEGSTIARLYNGIIYATNIALPSLKEQERIAEALSDVDNMISSLEKLIAKKKAIKQGAMQELLTGKKRLPGFTGEWVEKKIEDIVVRFATGLNPRQNFKLNNGGTNYYVTIKDFREGKLFLDDACDRIDDAALERINERSDLKKSDLLFSSIGRIGDAYLITETPKNWNINESVFALRPNQQIVSPLMLYYLLTSEDLKNKLLDSTTGSTLKSIKLGHLKEITCRFPKVIVEQTAIASILSDMDNEIETLEQKLAKTRQVKQGMMQQLLTGKIRLVSVSANNKPIEAVSKPHHNHQFDDAVVIAAIVNEFYADTIPLGRKKIQKLLYLLRRKQEADTSAFKKKAAGPYADEVRYKGGEPIAIRSKYVVKKQGMKGTTFSKGEKIESALEYIEKWELTDDINWLVSTFKYTKTNDLELFATIDMAMCDLLNAGEEVSVSSIKNLIASNKEWKDKLSKTYFSDNDIARAIRFCQSTFN